MRKRKPWSYMSKLFSFSYLTVGLLFLCNPNFAVFDLLPDAIGYFFLAAGIVGMADVNTYFAEARRRFLTLAWVSVAKMAASFLLVYILAINAEQRAMVSVFSLGFAVVEAIFVFPAISSLLRGFSYIGERDGVLSVFPPLKALTPYTYVFFALKHIGSFLPEMVLISVGHLDPMGDFYFFNPIRLYPFLLVFTAALVLGFGIYFFRLWRDYFAYLRKDGDFTAYTEKKSADCHKALRANAFFRSKSRLLFVLVGALLLAIDLIADRNNLLPDALSGICFLLFFLLVRRERPAARYGAIAAGAYTLFSLAATVFQRLYVSTYKDYTAISYVKAARELYTFVEVFSVLEAVALLFTLWLLYLLLDRYLHAYTGLTPEGEVRIAESPRQRELAKQNKLFLVFGGIAALFRGVEVFLMTVTTRHIFTAEEANEFYKEGEILYFSRFEGSFWVTLLLTLVWIVYGISFLLRLRDEMHLKYCNFVDNP